MVGNGGLRMPSEGSPSRTRLEAPALTIVDPPVFSHDPVCGLFRMPIECPAPELHEQQMVQGAKDLLAADVTIVLAPPTNPSVERVYQPTLLRVLRADEGLMQLDSLSPDARVTGGDEGFEAQSMTSVIFPRARFPYRVLPDVETEELETRLAVARFERVGNPRFTGLQREAQGAQPLRHELLTLLHDPVILMQNHQVIGIHHHMGRLLLAPSREGVGDGRFEAVEGNVG